ncbi:flagellar basal body protein [Jannaschia sp. W003]|uniref:flagellar basal body protein n=1 Tax=Jannaschia sp. W003 TaxID=2867012 RepID=UPI0021A714A7|nr:flagellar basal body protein [Jannaschia sp. W003]UWQ21837.1 flagellar basal body protein [Jannaschia sp. W003]
MQMPAIMGLAAEAAAHAATRQAIVARNVANADTPGFRPFDLAPFRPGRDAEMRATRPNHLGGSGGEAWRARPVAGPLDPDGNGVALETEILRATEAQRAHDRALSVYQASVDILRAAIGRGR